MNNLRELAQKLVAPSKGILAADESSETIKKRFGQVGIEDSVENHRRWRELLFTTAGIEDFISGVILFDETIRQTTKEAVSFPQVLANKNIVPGIKVDQGKEPLPASPKEMITKGLDGLAERLTDYKNLGAKFTKWRAVYTINSKESLPSSQALAENAKILAQYAKISQEAGFVPIVEPEVLMEGGHTLEESQIATTQALKRVFEELSRLEVDFTAMLLKPNWVHPGLARGEIASREIAQATLKVMKAVVPNEVPGLIFLSGGDNPKNATSHLDKLNELDDVPWQLSFSFGRALQEPVLAVWQGKDENLPMAQEVFYQRARLNSLARSGKYKKEMENG